MQDTYVTVGEIVNTHGIRGELRVFPKTDFPEIRFAKNSKLYLFTPASPNRPEPAHVEFSRPHKTVYIVKFAEWNHINEVERLKGATLKVTEQQRVKLEADEYYFDDIIGCEVFTETGERLGHVKHILTPGANDVWVVGLPNGKEALIPYIDDIVRKVDTAAKRITIFPMEGLLDE